MAFTSHRLTVSSFSVFDMTGSNFAPTISDEITTTSGTATQTSDRLYYKGGSVTAASPVTFDLRGGSLLQPDGSSFSIVEITRIVVFCTSTTGRLIIGGGSNAVSGVTGFASKGCPFICGDIDVGITVTAGTGDILQIDASAGTLNYILIVEGRSA